MAKQLLVINREPHSSLTGRDTRVGTVNPALVNDQDDDYLQQISI